MKHFPDQPVINGGVNQPVMSLVTFSHAGICLWLLVFAGYSGFLHQVQVSSHDVRKSDEKQNSKIQTQAVVRQQHRKPLNYWGSPCVSSAGM